MIDFVSGFSDTMKSIINEDIINARKNENMVIYIDEYCREMEKMLDGFVEYKGFEVDDKVGQVREINKSKLKNKKQNTGVIISTEETYARAYKFNFKLNFKGDTRKTSVLLFVPLVSGDGFNFIIKGNKYCIPFQMIDSVTYNRVDTKNKYDEVCLKTAFQDIKMHRLKTQIKDVFGNPFAVNKYNLKFNSQISKVPFLLFYFATFGFYKTLEYFGLGNPVCGVKLFEEVPDDPEWLTNYYFFKFGNLFMSVRRSVFNSEGLVRDLIGTILSTSKRSISADTVCKVDYWTMALGSFLSPNNTLSGGNDLKTTFHIAVDPRTSSIIETFIGKQNLKTTYSVVRWMFMNYSVNVSKDMSLINKRLRLAEFIIDPLKQVMKQKIYHFKRTRGGYRDIKRLEDVFKINPNMILDSLIGKTAGGMNTGKFLNAVNDLSILHSITKATQTGPGAPSSGKGSYVPKDFKRLHFSMVGRTDLISTSVNSPGTSFNVLPNCKIDPDTLGFKTLFDKINSEVLKTDTNDFE